MGDRPAKGRHPKPKKDAKNLPRRTSRHTRFRSCRFLLGRSSQDHPSRPKPARYDRTRRSVGKLRLDNAGVIDLYDGSRSAQKLVKQSAPRFLTRSHFGGMAKFGLTETLCPRVHYRVAKNCLSSVGASVPVAISPQSWSPEICLREPSYTTRPKTQDDNPVGERTHRGQSCVTRITPVPLAAIDRISRVT